MTTYRVTLANREDATFEVEGRRPLLESLREQGVDLPYGCKYGGCITCAAKLTEGIVNQRRQVALNKRQINAGYVILCVARPMTDITLEIGVDSHGDLYRNPFLDPPKHHEPKAGIAEQRLDDGP
ncbi:MAG: 2Fe-2S iron-sulfur cluster-binding protein [Rhodobacter sp.]|nr:2Fe-2S iron-sulfur cluster-binding protein [Rhodobacter sp.]MCY4169762.1 2Fe-2S iron-sulfur cluster-binding protein [Rhodobacter sp.]MCY4240721.1 2Fe-2S iron-sulfur cluster-binding protein [Rhodobacter sp.]